MIEWFKSLFSPSPKIVRDPKIIDVGKASVTIILKGDLPLHTRKRYVSLTGAYRGPHPFGGDYIIDAEERFSAWRNAGSSGTLYLGDNEYVPLCNVESIKVEYEEHTVEVPW